MKQEESLFDEIVRRRKIRARIFLIATGAIFTILCTIAIVSDWEQAKGHPLIVVALVASFAFIMWMLYGMIRANENAGDYYQNTVMRALEREGAKAKAEERLRSQRTARKCESEEKWLGKN